MLGMKPPREAPGIRLVAVVIAGKKIYKKNLPPNAMNAAIFNIFTPENVAVIKQFPDEEHEWKS